MFDLYDTSTYSEVPEGFITFNGENLLCESGEVTIKKFTSFILSIENFLKSRDPDFRITEKMLNTLAERMYKTYNLNQVQTEGIKDFEKEVESEILRDFGCKKSDLTIKNYTFTIAQKEMIKYLSQENKEKLVDIINAHFKNKEKRYRLKQEIFYQGIRIDNDLFSDLCFCKDVETEHEIMNEYFAGLDEIDSKEELEDILNNEYLNLYPDLKQDVRERLMTNLGL